MRERAHACAHTHTEAISRNTTCPIGPRLAAPRLEWLNAPWMCSQWSSLSRLIPRTSALPRVEDKQT
eukprot:3306072-Alexandrium_andersonii.AAC.1